MSANEQRQPSGGNPGADPVWLAALFAQAPVAIVLADGDSGLVLDANPAAERRLGRPRAEWVGRPRAELPGLPGAERFQFRSGNRRIEVEWLRDLPDAPGVETGGGPAPIEALEQQAQAMRGDRLRALGDMAAGIAHELNQPLGGIRALAEQNVIARRRGWPIDPAEQTREMELLVEQADRMSRILNHVRQFAREAGRPEGQPTDLNEVATAAAGLVRGAMRARGSTLALELAPALPAVRVNPFSLEEVLLNLLGNARDAASLPDGTGRVMLRTGVVAADGREWVQVEIRDNGPGMAPEILARACEPFFTTKGPDGGIGLGLATARSIVESFGGSLRLESAAGQGTAAIVRLPVAEAGKEPP